MKTLNLLSPNSLTIAMVLLLFVFFVRCNDLVQEEALPPDTNTEEISSDWVNLLDQLDLYSPIIVQKNDLIQDAVDAALPGDVIYIEPGVYQEALKINRSDIKFVGLENEQGERVVLNPNTTGNNAEFFNIEGQVQNHDIANLNNARHEKRTCLLKIDRDDLGMGIAHYTFDLKLGEGEFDVVTVHRVIKEKRAFKPVKTKGDVFMVHGAIQDFDDIFLTAGAEEINDKTSAPFYLAANNVDVWGIDLGWTRVPMETTDFSFMKDWGVEKDIDHTLKAMSIARIIRGLSGQSFSRLNLLGFSYGVQVAYGAADRETQQHKICRDVKGLIPVDSPLKHENLEVQKAECEQSAYWLDKLNSGEYNHPWGVGLIQLGGMALADPHAPSPVPDFAGLTNIQVMNAIGSDHSAGWHFFGGNPFELYYSDPMRFVRLAVELSPHMPAQMFYEMSACGCPTEDVGYDDNLMAIDIPILNLSAGGSAGESMSYTSEQFTSSVDITNILISLVDDPTQDFGHADLWMGYEAEVLVWNKLHIWLINHQH